jgi:hypothetical protein
MLAAAATADVPTQMTVQGRLTDDTGEPATGSFFIHFRIFDQEVGGTELWPLTGPGGEGHSTSLDENGLWTLEVGSHDPLTEAVFASPECWLEVEVGDGGNPYEKLERILLNTSPYAYRAGTVDGASGGDVSSDITAPSFSAGSISQSGTVWVFQTGSTKPVVVTENNSGHGGEISLFDENAYGVIDVEADVDGEGGYLRVWGNQAQTSQFRVDGNYAGAGSPQVTISGSASSSYFTTTNTGNSSVQLPDGSIGADELAGGAVTGSKLGSGAVTADKVFDEPGVASRTDDYITNLAGGLETLAFRSIDAPSAGYVFVMATGGVSADHVNGTKDDAIFGVSDVNTGLPGNQDVDFEIPSAAASGTYYVPGSYSGLFSVSTGLNTFYLLGNESSGDVNIADIQMTLVFFTTARGTVDPTLAVPGRREDDGVGKPGGIGQDDIDAEIAATDALRLARLERQLEAIRTEMESMKAETVESDYEDQQ